MQLHERAKNHSELILAAEKYIWQNPETGYREEKTTAYLAERFRELGYELNMAEGITGFYTTFDTGRDGPTLLIFGELDSVVCPSHPDADSATGAVHACGHNAQCAALLGIAAALKEEGAADGLSGKIMLCAVPAEELLELEYRSNLRTEGKIRYFGGKLEFLARGYFDNVDLAFMVHSSNSFACGGGNNGCLAKKIVYKGRSAHAGGSPQDGINALYAATLGINAVNALRETFVDSNKSRFHPIITSGGDIVNAIPERTVLESYVRGATVDAIKHENAKINRALTGAALSMGANVEIIDIPGYSPMINDPEMIAVAEDAAKIALPDISFRVDRSSISGGSTDMGDISCIMPAVHPYSAGITGMPHGDNFKIIDPYSACVLTASWQLAMISVLLSDGAARAKRIIESFKPRFESKAEFLKYVDSLFAEGDRIEYKDGEATVRLQ